MFNLTAINGRQFNIVYHVLKFGKLVFYGICEFLEAIVLVGPSKQLGDILSQHHFVLMDILSHFLGGHFVPVDTLSHLLPGDILLRFWISQAY